MESKNVNFDEYTKLHDDEPIKRLEEYKSFVYFYEGMHVEEEVSNQIGNQQKVLVSVKSQLVNAKLHLEAKLQYEEYAHSDSEINTQERDAKLLERDVHSDSGVERPNMEIRTEPRLSKYVRRHHPAE